jgi:TP901 family phage tail tape measure protein
MAKKISSSEIAEDDLFGKIRESAEETIVIIDKLSKSLTETAETVKKSIGGAKFDSSKAIDNFVKSTEKANKLQKEAVKLEQERIRAEELRTKVLVQQQKVATEAERTQQQKIKTTEAEARAAEKAAAAAERQKNSLKNVAPAYKDLVDKTRDLKNRSKELAAQLITLEATGKKNSAEWRDVSQSYQKVTREAQAADKQLKNIDRTVGDNFRNVGNYEGAIDKLGRGLGALGLSFGIGSVVSNAGQKIVEFDQAIADLVSITGASGDDLEFFKEQSIEMGKEVDGGASAVIEAYKLIGSARPELLKNAESLNEVTQSAITLSQASGMTLPDAATALTSALNQFGASASESQRFMDALANGALEGSVEIGDAKDALLKFGGVAKSSNVSIEESVALIQALGPSFKSAEEVGTGLRNVMLKLAAPDALPKEAQEAMQGLGINFAEVTDKSKSFAERLEAMKPLLQDEAALIKVFGSENIIAAKAALTQTDAIAGLTDKMGTYGTTQDQAQARTQTLSFALNNLKESWNALFLQLSSGDGIGQALGAALNFIAENLGTIVGWALKAAAAWGIYQTALKAAQVYQNLFPKGLKATAQSLMGVFSGAKKAADGVQDMADGAQKAGRTLGAIPWMAIIGAVIELALAFYDAASGAAELRRQEELNEAFRQKAADAANARVSKRTQTLDKEIAALERKQKVDLAAAKTDKEKAAIEEKFLKDKEKLIKGTQKQVKSDLDAVNARKAAYAADLKAFQDFEKAARKRAAAADIYGGAGFSSEFFGFNALEEDFTKFLKMTDDLRNKYKVQGDDSYLFGVIPLGTKDAASAQDVLRGLEARVQGTTEKAKIYAQELDAVTEMTKDATTETEVNTIAHKNNTDKINAKIPKMKEVNTELQQQIDLVKELNEVQGDLTSIEADIDQGLMQRRAEALDQQFETELEQQIEYTKKTGNIDKIYLEELVDERARILKEARRMEADADIAELQRGHQLRMFQLRSQLEEEYRVKLAQEGITEEQKAKLKAQYEQQGREIDAIEIEYEKVLKAEILKINLDAQGDLDDIDREAVEKKKDLNKDLLDSQKDYKEQEKKNEEDANKKIEEAAKAHMERMKDIANLLTDYLVKQSEKRIAAIEKEIDKATDQRDYFQELAAQGNITAKESLAEQNRLIAEANAKKEREERRKQKIELANTVFQTYASKVEANSKNPLADTIRDISLLNQFISAFTPTYKDGTEDTGSIGRGVDGQGGFHAILHPHERVLTREQNARVGELSNEELANLAASYQAGTIVKKEGAIQIGNGWNTAEIVKHLQSLEQTIKNKPEHSLGVENVVLGAMDIVKQTKEGNTSRVNRYRVRR